MHIDTIKIKDFRNFQDINLNPNQGLNILIGKNGQGKTNLLEAIYYLAAGSSFRYARDRELVRKNAKGFVIGVSYKENNKINRLEIDYSIAKGKIIKLNDKRKYRLKERPRVVLFTPDDLFLLKGPPMGRRSMIDFILTQISPEYSSQLDSLNKILKRRNSILKGDNISLAMLQAIDKVFIPIASQIIMARLNIIQLLEKNTSSFYNQISGNEGSLIFKYAFSFPLPPGKINPSVLEKTLTEYLTQNRDQEKNRKVSLYGPHRDDINIYLNENPAKIFASQGQQRNIIVALKMAELQIIYQILGTFPVLLLDEVLAELDSRRKNQLISLLEDAPFQTFLTSVEISLFSAINGKIIRVKEGQLY